MGNRHFVNVVYHVCGASGGGGVAFHGIRFHIIANCVSHKILGMVVILSRYQSHTQIYSMRVTKTIVESPGSSVEISSLLKVVKTNGTKTRKLPVLFIPYLQKRIVIKKAT